jgi:periplasmic divalent cation tolerance protein
MTDKIVMLSTCASADEASRIARALVSQRLAACVNVVPGIHSVYRWKGEVDETTEWLLLIKSRRPLFERLAEALRQAHSYDVPEIVALPIVAGSESYLAWLGQETVGEE